MSRFPNLGRKGAGVWTGDGIVARYISHARRLKIENPLDLSAALEKPDNDYVVSNVMEAVIAGIKAGDLACAQVGVQFIEQNAGFTFGAILKSNTAKALRQAPHLTEEQVGRIRNRVITLLTQHEMPREWHQYVKLLKHVGLGKRWPEIESASPLNYNGRRAKDYLLKWARPQPAQS